MVTGLRLPFLFVFLLTTGLFAGRSIVLRDDSDRYEIGSSLGIFKDTTASIPIDSIVRSDFRKQFTHISRFVPNIGFSHSTCWFHFDLTDSSSEKREWIMDISMPSLHYVDFFVMNGDSVIQEGQSGFLVDKNRRLTPFRNPSMELAKSFGKTVSIFIRVKSETPIILPVFIREKNRYIAYDRFREFFFGLYFGALFIMAIYHFYLFFSIADRGYLWVSFFIICFGLGQMTAVYGFLSDWGFTNLQSKIQLLHVINFLAAFFGCLLSRDMIGSRQFTPRCDAFLKAILAILLALAALSPLMSFMVAERLIVLANFIPLPLLVLTAILAWRQGHRSALFYLLATSTFITGLLIYNLMYGLDLFPFQEFIYFIPNISFIITLTLFSVGLAEQINRIKREREEAREQILFDLNEKLRFQKEKSTMERELEHSRKMEAVGRLLSGVAHDMKNFLVPVLGYSQILRKGCRKDERLYRISERLINAICRLKDLATTLVDVSRKKPVGLHRVDLNAAIEQIGSLLKHSTRMGISIKTIRSTQKTWIDADEGMLSSALLNIGINAMDALPNGGTVTIQSGIQNLTFDHCAIKQSGNAAGLYAYVTIKDNGIGMDDEIKSHLFEPFFTTKREGKGTGLGLVGVYNCVKAHNGCIDVQSEPGKGCCIALYFPAAEESEVSPKQNLERLSVTRT
jgi:signal transduction histidine kinase